LAAAESETIVEPNQASQPHFHPSIRPRCLAKRYLLCVGCRRNENKRVNTRRRCWMDG
jgi:hypothetical protein